MFDNLINQLQQDHQIMEIPWILSFVGGCFLDQQHRQQEQQQQQQNKQSKIFFLLISPV